MATLAIGLAPQAEAQTRPESETLIIPSSTPLHRPPGEGGVRRWQILSGENLSLRRAPSAVAPMLLELRAGSVLSNFGCELAEGALWCEVRPFRGGPRGFLPAKRLQPAMGPDGTTPVGPNDSRRRARKRDFDAKGEVACAQEQGQALGVCNAAVARAGGGDATVAVTFPNGFTRQLYFVHGEFVSASATMSGVGEDTDWERKAGLHRVRVDDQRYELSEALIFGK